MGHLGFSYIRLIFMLMLFVPNIIWAKKIPKWYKSENENKVLLIFERLGQIATTMCALMFDDFNLHGWTNWTVWLVVAFVLMLIYEVWWIRYFVRGRQAKDFYGSIFCVPLAGATLPVIEFFLLGIYGKVIWLIIAVIILGIGHIGIHIQHKNQL